MAEAKTEQQKQAEQQEKEAQKLMSDNAPGGKGTQFFDASFTKMDRNGNLVLSDHLEEGERRYSEIEAEKEAEASKKLAEARKSSSSSK